MQTVASWRCVSQHARPRLPGGNRPVIDQVSASQCTVSDFSVEVVYAIRVRRPRGRHQRWQFGAAVQPAPGRRCTWLYRSTGPALWPAAPCCSALRGVAQQLGTGLHRILADTHNESQPRSAQRTDQRVSIHARRRLRRGSGGPRQPGPSSISMAARLPRMFRQAVLPNLE